MLTLEVNYCGVNLYVYLSMRIKTVEIKDFRGLGAVCLENLDPHLNLLVGVNGAGKSSILDAISILLSSFVSRMQSLNGKGQQLIRIEDIKRGSRRGCELTIEMENGLKWNQFKSQKVEKEGKSDFVGLNEYVKQLRASMDDSPNMSIPIVVHYRVERSVTDIPLKINRKKEVNRLDAYINTLNSYASYREFFPWFKLKEDIENEIIRDNADYRDRDLNAVREAIYVMFPEYSNMRVRRHPHQEITLQKNGIEYPLAMMSEGEKCYIALVCDIVRKLAIANPIGEILKGEGIVLIDEVDLHLHPRWEADIMPKLRLAFPNCQFVVTAHSPLVASNFDGKVYTVDCGEVQLLPRIYGLDYVSILQDFMGAPAQNERVRLLGDQYVAYARNNMQTQAEKVWTKLIALLGDPESDVLKKIKSRL